MLARLLTLLTWPVTNGTQTPDRLQRLAERIAINRTVAGVHFPVDSAAGQLLGTSLADYLVCVASCRSGAPRGANSTGWTARVFNRDQVGDKGRDFVRTDLDNDVAADAAKAIPVIYTGAPLPVPLEDQAPLEWLWAAAAKEWA